MNEYDRERIGPIGRIGPMAGSKEKNSAGNDAGIDWRRLRTGERSR